MYNNTNASLYTIFIIVYVIRPTVYVNIYNQKDLPFYILYFASIICYIYYILSLKKSLFFVVALQKYKLIFIMNLI